MSTLSEGLSQRRFMLYVSLGAVCCRHPCVHIMYPTHLLKVIRDVLIPPLAAHNARCLSPETVLAKLEERSSGIPGRTLLLLLLRHGSTLLGWHYASHPGALRHRALDAAPATIQ